jgi:hypothetical protein
MYVRVELIVVIRYMVRAIPSIVIAAVEMCGYRRSIRGELFGDEGGVVAGGDCLTFLVTLLFVWRGVRERLGALLM